MNQRVKLLVTSGLSLLLLAFFSIEPLTLTLSQREREIVNLLEGPQTKARSKRSSTLVVDLFRTNCARCHGADGRGDTPLGHTYNAPDFTDAEWWRKHAEITSTGRLVSIVNHGKGGMPAFGKKLKPSEIKLLVNYVRRFRKS
jgi:cytochrome c5